MHLALGGAAGGIVFGEDLQGLGVPTNNALPDVADSSANLLGRDNPQLASLELLNEH